MNEKKATFGERVRELRTERKITLRSFAKMIGVSPTYLSKMERDEDKPPSEKKVLAIAKALGQDPDEFLALAGKVSEDLTEIIRRQPKPIADFLRQAGKLSAKDFERLTKQAKKLHDR